MKRPYMKRILATGFDTNNCVLTVMIPLHEIKHKLLKFYGEYDYSRYFISKHFLLVNPEDKSLGYEEYVINALDGRFLSNITPRFFATGDAKDHVKAVVHPDINRLFISVAVDKVFEGFDVEGDEFTIEINNNHEHVIDVIWSHTSRETGFTTREVIPVTTGELKNEEN